MLKSYGKLVAIAVLSGMVGVLATVGALHVWQDHQTLHAIVKLINDNAAQQSKHP